MRQNGVTEHQTTSVGLITAGSILAVGISAAYIAIVVGLHGSVQYKPGPLIIFLAATSAIASVAAYVFAVVFGLAVLNRDTETRKAQELKRATISLFLQAFSAAIFALVVIIGTLYIENGEESEATRAYYDQANTHEEIFADSRNLQNEAIDQLEEGNIREAAEISWGAAKRATDALILARTGSEPITVSQTSDKLEALSMQDPRVISLIGPYYSRLSQLHYACFYDGACKPGDKKRIRETTDYIRDAESLSED